MTRPSSKQRVLSQQAPTAASSNNGSQYEWWRKSIVRRTVNFVENDLECVLSQSPFLQAATAAAESFPNKGKRIAFFHRSEIVTGKQLGLGGFSVVHEITGFQLRAPVSNRLTPEQVALRRYYQQTAIDPSTGRGRYAIKHLQDKLLSSSFSSRRSSSSTSGAGGKFMMMNNNPGHAAAAKAAKDFSYAASDLAVEACFLSALDHEHILQLRALPVDGIDALADGQHDGYFIVTDRLVDTLDERIKTSWKAKQQQRKEQRREQQQQRLSFRSQDSQEQQQQQQEEEEDYLHVQEKMNYALQLAKALDYLHDRRIVFRDLKPQNIGFTADGSLRLFDFGLCRELPSAGHHLNDLYEMSGVGTRRYMAVEIINSGRYNCKADVYGWSMVVYEMLSGTKPYPLYSCEDHRIAVCQGGERPPVNDENASTWPHALTMLLQQSWIESVQERCTMKQVCHRLQQIIVQEQQQRQQRLREQQQQQQLYYQRQLSQEDMMFAAHSNHHPTHMISKATLAPDSPKGVDELPLMLEPPPAKSNQHHNIYIPTGNEPELAFPMQDTPAADAAAVVPGTVAFRCMSLSSIALSEASGFFSLLPEHYDDDEDDHGQGHNQQPLLLDMTSGSSSSTSSAGGAYCPQNDTNNLNMGMLEMEEEGLEMVWDQQQRQVVMPMPAVTTVTARGTTTTTNTTNNLRSSACYSI